MNRTYIAIDLKSFYASVECIERGLDPMDTNLVVADVSRTNKTICLAVSPSLKKLGISGRARLFEVVSKVKEANEKRRWKAPYKSFKGTSTSLKALEENPTLELSYIAAPPRMAHYIEYSSKIYNIYLKYIAPEDIHIYSIDEVFMDVTSYLKTYNKNAEELARMIINDVYYSTKITATAGIGPNLYLAKVAMDIVAKRMPADKNGVRVAYLDEISYRKLLWDHTPLTDFWRVGKGYRKKLEENGLYTMGDIARCSLGGISDKYNEDLLYKLFGVNAELLIDHAWGMEPCTMEDIKAYKPESTSIGSGQVLHSPYTFAMAKIVVNEMIEQLSLDLVEKHLLTKQIVLTVGYDIENVNASYEGEITTDFYGRKIPKHAHGTATLKRYTSSTKQLSEAVLSLYDKIVNKNLLIRRINMSAIHLLKEEEAKNIQEYEQTNLFEAQTKETEENIDLEKEKQLQKTLINIKKKYGKNAVLKVMDLEKGATAKERNKQIGGHKA